MTSLKHRIPVRLRQNWKLVAWCAAFLAACCGVFGSGTIRPYVTSAKTAEAGTVVTNLTGTKDLFDPDVAHDVRITFTDAAYQDMLTEFFKDGEKKYVEADLTVDGTRVPSVGVRLKGNSTLMGLTWKGQAKQRRVPAGERRPEGLPEGFRPPDGMPPPGQPRAGRDGGFGGGFGGGGGPGGFGAQLKGEEPENLPWLISFDEFVAGRRYQGHSQVAVRPASTGSAAMLNEALGISVVGAAGEPTQRSTYSAFTVNGRAAAPRLLVEYLDEGYAERLGDGVLYKSLASGSFTYKGEDQTEYTEDFKQVNKVGGKDLQPVIDLVKWVNEASAAEFAEGLDERLDVQSFARYLALQNLMANFDDMAGPGKNYYLWYDLDTGKFRVITWDLNLAFSGNAESGARDTTRTSHPLKEKFLANAAFKQLYEEQYRALYAGLLADGTAAGLLDGLVAAYGRNEGADPAKIEEEARTLRAFLETRTRALGSDQAISGP
ncbi:CotH kinase family protein [Actinomadura sp. ATCC 31491]|uniref:CotH kinase family protein n=1 Tax=Actinomadura luzonensis TaxID=2805427 RepID=A0ABT0G1D1_9ACTN|nr:CotH kinase family protein [Actinomadura luzonensis]MCK2218393.1 CotH kinase family protein [Actinomadura luzonensis]